MEKKRILLVDDEVTFTELLKLNLEQTGAYEVRVENKGSAVLAVARAFKPHLILMDIVMPDVDGGQVAAQLQADPRLQETPIVFLTAVVTKREARKHQGVIVGFPLIAKPVSTEELIASIERYAGTSRPIEMAQRG
jgi:CheY-like chemotaxis protein